MASVVNVPGGSYPGEVSWTLSCAGMCEDDDISGTAPYDATHSVPPGAACTLAMVDSYGDGWNGASFNAPGWIAGGGAFEIAGGATGSASFTAPTEAIVGPV